MAKRCAKEWKKYLRERSRLKSRAHTGGSLKAFFAASEAHNACLRATSGIPLRGAKRRRRRRR